MAEEKEQKRLRPKYVVRRILTSEPNMRVGDKMLSTNPDDVDSPFVLMPAKDPAAFMAMMVYAVSCEQRLGIEVRDWLYKIAEAEPKYGTQGMRNYKAQTRNSLDKLNLL